MTTINFEIMIKNNTPDKVYIHPLVLMVKTRKNNKETKKIEEQYLIVNAFIHLLFYSCVMQTHTNVI